MKRPYVKGIPQVVISFKALINKDKSFLFVKRSPKAGYSPGLWDLPGGKLEVGEDVNKTLQREVKEETNLIIKQENQNFYIEKHKSDLKKHGGLMYIKLWFKSNLVKGKPRLSEENTDYKWLTLKQALKLDLTSETKRSLLSLTRTKR